MATPRLPLPEVPRLPLSQRSWSPLALAKVVFSLKSNAATGEEVRR